MKAICQRCRAEGRLDYFGQCPPYDDLGEAFGLCWVHRLAELQQQADTVPADEPQLVVVANHKVNLFVSVSEQFLHLPGVSVILDRRRSERRRPGSWALAERRQGERRQAPDYWDDVRHHPVVLPPRPVRVARDERPGLEPVDARPPAATPAPAEMVGAIAQWSRQSREIFTRTLPALFAECDDLRQRAASAEAQNGQLRDTVRHLETEVGRLGLEIERVKRQQAAAVDDVERAAGELRRLTDRLRLTLGQP